MNIAIYIRHLDRRDMEPLQELVAELENHGVALWMPQGFMAQHGSDLSFSVAPSLYPERGTLPRQVSFLLSIGGDGTLLSSVHLVSEHGQPILGVNFGHLGFLTAAGKGECHTLAENLLEGNYTVERRTLLQLTHGSLSAFALNEVSLHRGSHLSLLASSLYVDNEYVATYVADGLIAATPTGSTAYSLSCGGPILTPNSHCFAVTPIAAHTLTLRPIIIPDTSQLRIETPPGTLYSLGIDSRTVAADSSAPVVISKAPFTIPLLRLPNQSFFTAIREKLNWGR